MFEHDPRDDEFDHSYENVAEDDIPDRDRSLRVAVWVVSAVIAVVIVALPVVRVIELRDKDDEFDVVAGDAQARVATRLADAILIRRSTDDALQWAQPSLRAEIDAIVDELNRRPAADLAGATGNVARVACDPTFDDDRQCFHAWLRRPVAFEFIRLLIVVEIVNGDAVVVAIQRVNVV